MIACQRDARDLSLLLRYFEDTILDAVQRDVKRIKRNKMLSAPRKVRVTHKPY